MAGAAVARTAWAIGIGSLGDVAIARQHGFAFGEEETRVGDEELPELGAWSLESVSRMISSIRAPMRDTPAIRDRGFAAA